VERRDAHRRIDTWGGKPPLEGVWVTLSLIEERQLPLYRSIQRPTVVRYSPRYRSTVIL
jgi:hypothetical protein